MDRKIDPVVARLFPGIALPWKTTIMSRDHICSCTGHVAR